MSAAASLAGLLACALLGAAVLQWRLEVRCRLWARRARRLALRAHDHALRQRQQQRLADAQRLGEDLVDVTNSTVRSVHKGIASIPFTILRQIPATRDTTQTVQQIHDTTADVVYESIAAVNRLVGAQLRRGLKSPVPPPPAPDTPES